MTTIEQHRPPVEPVQQIVIQDCHVEDMPQEVTAAMFEKRLTYILQQGGVIKGNGHILPLFENVALLKEPEFQEEYEKWGYLYVPKSANTKEFLPREYSTTQIHILDSGFASRLRRIREGGQGAMSFMLMERNGTETRGIFKLRQALDTHVNLYIKNFNIPNISASILVRNTLASLTPPLTRTWPNYI